MKCTVIAGAGRSGTSMVSRILNIMGMSLGDANRMMPPTSGNSRGYWEHLDIVEINDRALRCMNAGWDAPPAADWTAPPHDLGPVERDARAAVASFATARWWGWKDPRNSFTLPFWRPLLEDPALVVCLRHPLDVAKSLAARHYLSEAGGLTLWESWNRRVLADGRGMPRVVTHYESFFEDPEREVRRIVAALGEDSEGTAIARAVATIDPDVRHHYSLPDAVLHHPRHQAIKSLYGELCAEAGRPDLAPG